MKQRTRILIYILVAIVVVILGSVAIINNHHMNKPVSAQEHIDLGHTYLIELSYEKAVIEFTEAIEIEPLNADAYLGLAEAYVGTGNTEKAIEILEKGYDKTGDGRLKDMLRELLPPFEETTVTTTEITTEETTIVSTAVMATVPDLSGLTEDEAIAACETAGLKYSISYEYSENIEKGYVIGQTIPANASVAEMISVPFTVSNGNTGFESEIITTTVTTPITVVQTSTAAIKTSEAVTTTAEATETTAETTRRVEYITIQGQRYSTSLTELDLSEMELTNEDIKSISDMVNLTALNLSENEISNISMLAQLDNLEVLNLESNYISDIKSLSKLTNLKELYLGENQISNISVLSKLTNLEILSLSANKISDINALSNLENLRILNVNWLNFDDPDQIIDINALSRLTNLENLSLDDNQISGISALHKLQKLEMLSLKHCEISNDDKAGLAKALPNCEIEF